MIFQVYLIVQYLPLTASGISKISYLRQKLPLQLSLNLNSKQQVKPCKMLCWADIFQRQNINTMSYPSAAMPASGA